jgi:hypothetical protein
MLPNFLEPTTPVGPSPALLATALPRAGSPLGGTSGAGKLPNFAVQIQLQTEWCWAAVSASVASFFGSQTWTQCKVAAAELQLNCCGGDASGPCNKPWYLDRALNTVGHFSQYKPGTADFPTVMGEIGAGRPLGCRVAWLGGGAHFVALGGWSVAPDGTEIVEVHDPYYNFSQVTYSDFVASYKSPRDAWTDSYFVKSGGPMAGGIGLAGPSPLSA